MSVLDDYQTGTQIAESLGVSRSTFFRYIRPRLATVPYLQVGRRKRFHVPSVAQVLRVHPAQDEPAEDRTLRLAPVGGSIW